MVGLYGGTWGRVEWIFVIWAGDGGFGGFC